LAPFFSEEEQSAGHFV